MTEFKRLWNPDSPCWNVLSHCKAFPEVDWNNCAWMVTTPDANLVEQRLTFNRYEGSTAVFSEAGDGPYAWNEMFAGNFERLTVDQVAALTGTLYDPDEDPEFSFFSNNAYHFRAGKFLAQYLGNCQWLVNNREELYPRSVVDFRVAHSRTGTAGKFNVPIGYFTDVTVPPLMAKMFPNTLEPFADYVIEPHNLFASWRDILRGLECELSPLVEANGWTFEFVPGGTGRALTAWQNARSAINAGPVWNTVFATPNAMDVAVNFAMLSGIECGIEYHRDSPFYGQFCIYTGGKFKASTDPSFGGLSIIQKSYELTSGNSVVAQLGVRNRFERTTDLEMLPEWLELELIEFRNTTL